MPDSKNDVRLDTCDERTIPCKNCKWGNYLTQYYSKSCAKYADKPYEVYYRSFKCKKFEPIDK